MNVLSTLCERPRGWASLRVDGELSELESALLDAHLGRCQPCRAFARGAEDVAAALASARLERPAPLALLLSVSRSAGRRHRTVQALRAAAAATLVAAVAAGATAVGVLTQPPSAKATRVAMVAGSDSLDRVRELRRAGLIEQNQTLENRAIPRNKQVPGESY
ncbi:MAG: zf-HC2 domain-containing protein [Actinobacteria bacterium]|nr:zf-HC2 domain-containing protein [Actinomycetota bacterium]